MAVFLDTSVLVALAIGIGMLVFKLGGLPGGPIGDQDSDAHHRARHKFWSRGEW